jgi:hypothetical protein
MSDGGKGSVMRKGVGYAEGYDRIFGKPAAADGPMKYLVLDEKLWPNDLKSSQLAELNGMQRLSDGGYACTADTLIAYDVKHRNSCWTFKVEGHGDTVYHTHYASSLAEYTPENLAHLRSYRSARVVLDEAKKTCERRLALIRKAPQ